MDTRYFAVVFTTVLLAELGDKTQLATLLFAARESASAWLVFFAAAAALVVATALAVLLGQWLTQLLSPRLLSVLAGLGFIAIGAWTLLTALPRAPIGGP